MRLSNRWTSVLLCEPETGMGYRVVRITLRDGRRFDGVTVVDGAAIGLPPEIEAQMADDDIAESSQHTHLLYHSASVGDAQ